MILPCPFATGGKDFSPFSYAFNEQLGRPRLAFTDLVDW